MEESYQVLFNAAVGIIGVFGGWMLSRIFTLIDRLDKDVRNMPVNYITKQDYRDDIKDIKLLLEKIEAKLDQKADK